MRSARLATEYSGLRYWMGTAPRHLVHRRSCFLNISTKTASSFEPVGAHPVVYSLRIHANGAGSYTADTNSKQSTLFERRTPFFSSVFNAGKCLQDSGDNNSPSPGSP